MTDDYTAKTWEPGQPIDLTHLGAVVSALMPIEAHVKADGDIHDEPSICWVLINAYGQKFVAQISARMFLPTIEAIRKFKPDYAK